MAYIGGYRQYLKIDGNPVGIITGGGARDVSELVDARGIGNHFSQNLRPAGLRPEGNCTVMVQLKRLLEQATRNANGTLNSFDITYGDADQDGYTHKNCKLNSLRLSFRGGEPLMADVNWRALWFETGGTDTHTPPADGVLMFYEGTIAGLAGAPEFYGGEIMINNNVDWLFVIDSAMADKARRAKYLVEGPAVATASFRLAEYYATDISADAIANIAAITVTFAGDNTVVATLTNCKPEIKETPFTPQGTAEHVLSVKAMSFTIT